MVYSLKSRQEKDVEKDDYIRTCIHNAISFNDNSEMATLVGIYKQLSLVKSSFISFVETQLKYNESEALIHKDYGKELPDDLYNQAVKVFSTLLKEDKILAKTFSLFQKSKTPSKQSVSNELELFANISGIQKNYCGEIKKYYLVYMPINNDSYLQGINFLE